MDRGKMEVKVGMRWNEVGGGRGGRGGQRKGSGWDEK